MKKLVLAGIYLTGIYHYVNFRQKVATRRAPEARGAH